MLKKSKNAEKCRKILKNVKKANIYTYVEI